MVQAFFHQQQRHVIDGFRIDTLDDCAGGDVAEARHFGAHCVGEFVFRSAHQDVRLNTEFEQLLHGVLGRFGLELSGCRQVGDEGQVHNQGLLGAFPLHLTHRLDVGQGLNVADRSPNFSNDEVKIRFGTQDLNAALDFIRDVWNDLNGLTEVLASAFFVNDRLVNPAGGVVVGLRGLDVQEPLVVPQVQVRFGTINRDVALPVFVGV